MHLLDLYRQSLNLGAAASLPIGDEAAAKTYVSMVDKIILIGGQNVDPKYYQEEGCF